MRKVKTFAELHKAGASVEGLRFVEVKDRGHLAATLETVLARIDRNSDTIEAALYASLKAIVETVASQEIVINVPEEKPVTRWVFDFERDRDGYMKRIVARAER